jgi:hypothetical protein
MRRLALIVMASCTLAASAPAHALETLKFCDNIAAPAERMTCLQAHISNLEERLLTLSNSIVTLEKVLDGKLNAAAVYKLQHAGKGACLVVPQDKKDGDPALGSCNRPDSWKLISGAQKPDKRGRTGDDDKDKDKDRDKDKDKDKSKDGDKDKDKDKSDNDKDKKDKKSKAKKSDTSEQSKSKPAPAQ